MKARWFKQLLTLVVAWSMVFLPLQVYASQIAVDLDAGACQHMLHDAALLAQPADANAMDSCLECINDCPMGYCNGHCNPINSVVALPVGWQVAQAISPTSFLSIFSDHIQDAVPSGLFRPPTDSTL